MGSRWARFKRWLGFDRNPLRRRSDRIEVVLRLVVLLLVFVGVPVAAIATGQTMDHVLLRHAQAQRAEKHLAQATLTGKAIADNSNDPYANVPVAWVPARWAVPGGSAHRGEALAPVGDQPGSKVTIWIDRTGAVTSPPMSRSQIGVDVAIAVMTVAELGPMLLVGLQFFGRYLLNVRRWQAWETDWEITGPQWRRNRAQ